MLFIICYIQLIFKQMKKIYNIFKEYKYKLLLIYFFMLLTELSIIIQPYLLGKSIDGLVGGTWLWIILLFISYCISNLFNYKRMVYDTKVYTQIYNDIVLRFLKNNNEPYSVKVARTDMAHDIVGVLEGYVHYYIATIITIFGSIGFIYMTNWKVGLLVTLSLIVIIFSVLVFYKKIRQGINVRNNHYENKVTAIQNGYDTSVSFFNRRRKLEISESTLQGKNWFFVGMIKSIFLVFSIILLITTSNNITVGSVITTYSYVNNFLISLMSIPVAFEMYSRLTNIIKRIN
jgi:ABC-type multidrug transport system fused ATPase/permease subunit